MSTYNTVRHLHCPSSRWRCSSLRDRLTSDSTLHLTGAWAITIVTTIWRMLLKAGSTSSSIPRSLTLQSTSLSIRTAPTGSLLRKLWLRNIWINWVKLRSRRKSKWNRTFLIRCASGKYCQRRVSRMCSWRRTPLVAPRAQTTTRKRLKVSRISKSILDI